MASPVLVAAAVVAVVWVGAGDLNPPPGSIQPTNRVQLNSQAITLPYTINQAGSYVLTSDLSASGPGDGIEIAAGDVSLDLNGFGVFGNGNPGSGIRANGALKNIEIRNGTVGDWGDHGVDLSSASACRMLDLRLVNNGLHGVLLGSGSVTNHCLAEANGDAGFRTAGDRNRIESNHSMNNARGFFIVGAENLLVKNTAGDNGINYVIGAGNGHGPIVTSTTDLAAVANGDHPWANFNLNCPPVLWCRDLDNDQYGDPNNTISQCTAPLGYVADCQDCDDSDPQSNPDGEEVCDGADNNCDGQTDESDPQLGQTCNTGQPGICNQGTIICQGGTLVCQPDNGPMMEVCNNQDDNCNGQVDESDPQLGQPCSTGQPGVCSQGTIVCQGGALVCQPNQGPSAETCNNLDDDCDGTVDEGNPCPMGFNCVFGACQPLSPNGTPCTMGSQCQSGFCVDGVCCNTACSALCVACTAALKGSGVNGTCGNIANGTDPQNECSGGTPNCNGGGACGP